MARRARRSSKRSATVPRAWPRRIVDAKAWVAQAEALGRGESDLVALWGEVDRVHMAVRGSAGPQILTLAVNDGRFPSVGSRHAPAIRLERAIRDLFGHEPHGLADTRPWLDHGAWPLAAPLSKRRLAATPRSPTEYKFLPVEGEDLHQIPVGPVHAGIIEPGHFRFTANGETVVRLEERLRSVPKGVEWVVEGGAGAPAAPPMRR